MADVFRLKELGLALAPSGGVVKRATVQDMAGATDLLATARAEAERIVGEAHDAFAAEKDRGYAEGWAEAQREAAARLVDEQKTLDDTLARLEGEIGDLVLTLVRQVIHQVDDAELVRRTARAALATIRTQKRAQLYVPSETLDATRAAIADIMAEFPEMELVDVIEDHGLRPPSLRLESDLGVVSFVLENTLDDLRKLLTG